MADTSTSLEDVVALTQHPGFDRTNPNAFRSLVEGAERGESRAKNETMKESIVARNGSPPR